MSSQDPALQNPALQNHLRHLSARPLLPAPHEEFLRKLRDVAGFVPRVAYDIGACVLHWTLGAKRVWPDARYVLFDAFESAAFLYEGYDAHVGVLSDADGRVVRYYENKIEPGGNSYYRECMTDFFPKDDFALKTCRTLDSVVAERGFPAPDLVKIDVQGSEKDIIAGGLKAIADASVLIVEMQHVQYNEGAPLVGETKAYIESLGWTCVAERFSDNGPDADYCFVKTGGELEARLLP